MTASSFSKKYEKFKQLLQQGRHDKCLTQGEVANALGKPQSFVSKYESGERRIDIVEFLEIADVLGIDPVSLLNELREETK